MNSKLIAMATVAVALAAGASAHAGELIVNGGFDADNPGAAAPVGWTLTQAASGSDFFVGTPPFFSALSAPNTANFGAFGDGDDVLSQVIATTAGEDYTFSFDLAHIGLDANDFSASFDGATLLNKVDNADFNFTHFSFAVTATSNATTVSFAGREVQDWYELDNVSVTSVTVPEPATWALMICGFGLAGAALRRRRALA
ncbi:PEPxxWA-CTERM sorting domain-containing protein [Phenylobacterium sp.]|jgi:hypothetical protein|uniref:PEPxxWA-CTERM sorting domain-containing protein n=1 Tax=Phenylobacterium sp. TaxID=1871053 RepID=UPI002F3F5816